MPGRGRFQEKWTEIDDWSRWLRKGKDEYQGFCSFCNKSLDISHSGSGALIAHSKSNKHAEFERHLNNGKEIILHSVRYAKPVPLAKKFGRGYVPKRPVQRNFRDRNVKVPVLQETESGAIVKVHTADLVSWNTEEKGSPEEVDKLLRDNQKILPHFVLLQNTKLPAAGEGSKHFKWFSSGEVGSAILVNKGSKWEVKAHDQICNQISVVQAVREDNINLVLVSCYIPPAMDYQCKDVWDKLANVLKDIPSNVHFVIGGDFNAQIGPEQKKGLIPACCGNLLYHEDSDENGTKLLKLVKEAHLRIVNTHGPPDSAKDKLFTFKDGEIKTQQDFIMIPVSRTFGYSRDVRFHWVPEYNHAMSSCEIIIDPTNNAVSSKEVETNVTMSTWNIQGATPSKVDKVLQEQGLEVICLQELFLTSEEDIQSDHYVWLSSKQQWAKNVAILVKKSPDILVNNFTVISENLCVADIEYRHYPVKVISCHLPARTDPRHEAVASQISEVVKGIPADTVFIMAGDLGVRNIKDDEEKDKDNLPFWKKLAEETGTNLVSYVWGSNGCPFLTSKNDVLTISTSKTFGRRIVFFETSILCLKVSFAKKTAPSNTRFDFEGNLVARSRILKTIDEVVYNITTIEYHDPTGDIRGNEVGTVKPSPEDVEKYSKSPPTVAELGRILEGLVLFNGVNEKSIGYKGKLQTLVMSFLKGNFGKLTTEHLYEMVPRKQNVNMRGTSRIRWNGIILSEHVADGEQKTLRRQNANLLYSKLGQIFYQVKAKVSFFCKGQPPMLIDDSRYSEVLQKVEKTKYPTMAEVIQYIEEFFAKDSDTELIFGTDFTKVEHEEIKKFAKIRKLGYRFFVSKPTEKQPDHIVVFIKRSPQYIRDKLMETKQDLKYMLVPPSGEGENFESHAVKYELEHFKDEEKLVHQFWKAVKENEKRNEEKRQESMKQESREPTGRNEVRRDNRTARKPSANKRQYQEYSRFDDRSRFRNDRRQPQNGRQAEGPPPSKRPREEGVSQSQSSNLPPNITWSVWPKLQPLLIVWPLTICSRLEDRATMVLGANFPVEYFESGHGSMAVVVRFLMRNGTERRFSVSIAETKNKAADFALQKLLKHSTVIKPSPVYLCDGGVPNFIRYKVPCQTYPRSYIILTQYDTGPLSQNGIRDIFDTFSSSYNEDLFFDKDGYTFNEKMMIIEEAPKFNLNVRHFGDIPGVINRYVCVYKTKPKEQILEEVLKMRGAHPKYVITTDRLPPYLGMNVF